MLKSVKDRYGDAAKKQEAALCCPVDYNPEYLKIIPQEVIEKDYGCGDPSQYVKEGDTVLDLGSGGGKICFIAAQIVGKNGKVIGVDGNPEMLDLANRNKPEIEKALGYKNIEFKYGHIQDLQLDLNELKKFIKDHPVATMEELEKMEAEKARIRKELTLIPDESIDIIVSNCVLNLVAEDQKKQLFKEMFRVLKKGGRIAISDIVSDEESPKHLKEDDFLWSGCISGALQEEQFLSELEAVGFYGITFDKYEKKPWHLIEGIEYRSVTVTAYKGKEGPCFEKNQAVIYKGPWKAVQDDDGHVYGRGERIAVCEKTFNIMQKEPYAQDMIGVEPNIAVTELKPFKCSESGRKRNPKETKNGSEKITTISKDCCSSEGCC